MFLMQYFCLHGILPFSKSYPEIESTWPTAKCRGRKSFDTWNYIVICATLCVSFSSKSKATNVFPKHILESKARDQSIQASKKLFFYVMVKSYLCNVLCKFLINVLCQFLSFFWSKKHLEAQKRRADTHADFTIL